MSHVVVNSKGTSLPGTSRVDQRQRDARQATCTGRGDELAANTLGKPAVNTRILSFLARAVGVERLELSVKSLRFLAVRQCE